ncbi:DUF2631 domain-containing protein [Gordonia sp. NPDC003424]
MASTEVEPVDTGWVREPADAPSARFGWHGQARKSFLIAGWFFVAFLLLMMIGNHRGHVEDIWLIATALVLAYFLIKASFGPKGAWRK